MRIIVGILHFDRPNGAATYAHVLARHLSRLGHEVAIHTPDAGALAELARGSGLEVGELPRSHRPDALIAQDAMVAFEMAERWPGTPQLFVAHGAYRDEAMPPQLREVASAAIAMNDRVASRLRALAADVRVVRLRQPIDVERFRPRGRPHDQPRRALLLGNHLRGASRDVVFEAVGALGASPHQAGEHGNLSLRPEREIAEADFVIGYGRSALEGMACGRPTFVLDHRGADGWVTRESYSRFESDGFAGLVTDGGLDPKGLHRALSAYDPALGATGRKLALVHHDAFRHAAEVSTLLKELARPPRLEPGAAGELARLSRLQWESEWRSSVLLEDVAELRERLDASETTREASERHASALAAEMQALRKTRRYRVGLALARPLDLLRGYLRRRRP